MGIFSKLFGGDKEDSPAQQDGTAGTEDEKGKLDTEAAQQTSEPEPTEAEPREKQAEEEGERRNAEPAVADVDAPVVVADATRGDDAAVEATPASKVAETPSVESYPQASSSASRAAVSKVEPKVEPKVEAESTQREAKSSGKKDLKAVEPKKAPPSRKASRPASSMKLSDAIRRQRTRTHPGVAPPANGGDSNGGSTGDAGSTVTPPSSRRGPKVVVATKSPVPPQPPPAQPKPVEAKTRQAAPKEAPQQSTGITPPTPTQLDPGHIRAVEVFRLDLQWGNATARWARTLPSRVDALRDQANALGRDELAVALGELSSALGRVPRLGSTISAATHEELLVHCGRVRDQSDGDLLDEQRLARNERFVLDALLRSAAIAPLCVERLHSHGFVSFSMFDGVDPAALASRTGIETGAAVRVADVVREFLATRGEKLCELAGADLSEALLPLVENLQQLDSDFSAACDADDPKRKRDARRQRADRVHDIALTLAQLGCAPMLNELEPLCVRSKVDTLRKWIASESR